MTVARKTHSNNIVAGAGEVKLALRFADGTYDGERYVGDSSAMSLAVTRNVVDIQSGDGATPRTIEEIVTSTERVFSLTLNDMNPDNLALFFQATVDEQTDDATEVVDEVFKVNKGRWYILGQSSDVPLGIGAASQIVVSDSKDGNVVQGATPKVTTSVPTEDDDGNFKDSDDNNLDIVADLKRGTFFVTPKAPNISDGDTIYVDYTPVAKTRKRFKSSTKSQQGALHYIEQSQDGATGQDIYARLCSITANGELPFKDRNANQSLSLSLKVLVPSDGYPAIAGIDSMGPDSYDG